MGDIPKPVYTAATIVLAAPLAASLLISTATAQSMAEMKRLVFEPVPLVSDAEPRPPVTLGDTAEPLMGNGYTMASRGDALLPGSSKQELQQAIDQYRANIEEVEGRAGPFSPKLLENLIPLGELHQRRGEHEAAIDVFQRAQHISRVNNGLHALDQIPVVESTIDSLVAAGQMQEANNKQEYLLYLHQQHYGPDARQVAPALNQLATWHMNAFHRAIRYEADSVFNISFDSVRYGSEDDVYDIAFRRLGEARDHYLEAIGTLVSHEAYDDPLLLDMERRLVETYFLQAHAHALRKDALQYLDRNRLHGSLNRWRGTRNSGLNYRRGREAYERMLQYLLRNPDASTTQLARTLVDLGDWHLLFGHRSRALEAYQEAYDMMAQSSPSAGWLERTFQPAIPVTLPTFTPTPNTHEILRTSPEQSLPYQGHIDLTFKLTEYGSARDVQVLGRSEGTGKRIERRLVRLIRTTQFRPRFDENAPVDNEEVALRYYYTY